jgi:hypothetical protein
LPGGGEAALAGIRAAVYSSDNLFRAVQAANDVGSAGVRAYQASTGASRSTKIAVGVTNAALKASQNTIARAANKALMTKSARRTIATVYWWSRRPR